MKINYKIELTDLQLDKIIEVLKEKFQSTHNAMYLGLQHNLEWQKQQVINKKLKKSLN